MSFEARLHALSKCEFFGAVSESDRAALVEVMREEKYAEGETVCRAGEPSDRVYVVASGTLDVTVPGRQGSVRHLHAGDLFGEYGMFDEGVRTATVTCLTPATLLTLDYPRFRMFLLNFPEATLSIFGATVRRLQALEQGAV